MLGVLLSLACALSWGAADFLGGLTTRRGSPWSVILLAQAGGAATALAGVAIARGAVPDTRYVLPAIGAGVIGAFALFAFYRALAIGTMSVVAPIVATSAAIPALAGIARGEQPGALRVAGIVLAFGGVLAAAREHADHRGEDARLSVVLALVAAVGLGTDLVLLDSAAEAGAAWATLFLRAGSATALVLVALALRPVLTLTRGSALPILAVGVLDTGASLLYALATRHGLLSVVSIVSSLYPVTTVLLARGILGERLRPLQAAGVVAAMGGVVVLAAAA